MSADAGATERAEALLREAHVLRMRRQFADAEAKCREALALCPTDLTGLEMLGDLLAEKGTLQEAVEAYGRAREAAPGRPSLEQKHARLVLQLGEQHHERAMAEYLLQNPRATRVQARNPVWAFLLSALWPGFGQLYNREIVKGLVIAGIGLVTFLLGGDALVGLVFGMLGARGANTSGASALGFIFVSLWVYSLIDAPLQAQKLSSRERGGFM